MVQESMNQNRTSFSIFRAARFERQNRTALTVILHVQGLVWLLRYVGMILRNTEQRLLAEECVRQVYDMYMEQHT